MEDPPIGVWKVVRIFRPEKLTARQTVPPEVRLADEVRQVTNSSRQQYPAKLSYVDVTADALRCRGPVLRPPTRGAYAAPLLARPPTLYASRRRL